MKTKQASIFDDIVRQIPDIGLGYHLDRIFAHAKSNAPEFKKTIKDLPPLKEKKALSGIVISAGPSLFKRDIIRRILKSDYQGTIIAIDASYVACLKAGLVPDFLVTMDPNPTRMVRWFGDHNFEAHTKNDDYYTRQDLNVEFRRNSIEQNKLHIELVNQHGHLSKGIIGSSAPANVLARMKEANFDLYWWNPLMDNPAKHGSLTRKLYAMNKLPCMNTGGNVGTTAWVFANSILKLPHIALTGMDLGYYRDTPFEMTQTYYELLHHIGDAGDIRQCFKEYEFPLTKERYYTDPTYYWYRKNILELLVNGSSKTVNCTEGGTLFSEQLPCASLDGFLDGGTSHG